MKFFKKNWLSILLFVFVLFLVHHYLCKHRDGFKLSDSKGKHGSGSGLKHGSGHKK